MSSTQKPVVLVTGASKGIGLATTKILLQDFNAIVVGLARSRTPEVDALVSDDFTFIECDVANEAAFNKAIDEAKKIHQRFDGLVLNAAILAPMCRIGDDTPLDAWKLHFDVGFFSLVTALKATLPDLRTSPFGGRVVFVSSGAAFKGYAGWAPYCASKAAMNSLCRTLAEEEPNVTSVALRPGMVDTGMQTTIRDSDPAILGPDAHAGFVRVHSEGKLVRPEDSGYVIAALALKATKDLSGQFVVRRVDIHHHCFPRGVDKAKASADAGWRTPSESLPWDPQVSLRAMEKSDVDKAILSTPATSHGLPGLENRAITRDHNIQAAAACAAYPSRFGFFAALPLLYDVLGALAEIDYALDELNADGISLSSSYGEGQDAKYVGDQRFEPIWKELDRRRAVVFLHGCQIPSSTPYPHEYLGLPITEVPNETFKAASHLVVTGMKRKYPNVKIILAHLGGTPCSSSSNQIDFSSARIAQVKLTLLFPSTVCADRLSFNITIAVSPQMSKWYTDNLESFYASDPHSLHAIMAGNALRLFPRLRETVEHPQARL
ncbi:hypothetical protein EYR36_006375 [Pleurotus pulmonarius]|nr:hypothetical protein EYR36_006375 [Pleurotus pulmonarius]KAF4601073.1 hypothetical protein EYR38_005723 [Pleurotus pulmonarius]